MVVPPLYSDIGKLAKDLLTKGFNHDQVRVEWKNKLQRDTELNVTGVHASDSGKLSGTVETKSSQNDYNFTGKWTTDNRLSAEATCEDKLLSGLKLKAEGSFEPNSFDKSAKIEAELKLDGMRAVADAKFLSLRPTLHTSLTLGLRQFKLGSELSYDSQKMAFKGLGIAASYEARGVTLTAAVTELKNLNASVYHRVSPRLETATSIDWTLGQPQTRISFGNKIGLANGASFKGVINSAGIVGVAYTHTLTDGVKATLSSEFDAKQFANGKQRFGLTVEFDSSSMRF